MNKDFDAWNFLKKNIDQKEAKKILFHEREIWWCSFGTNIGSEQNGIGTEFSRPILIIKKLSPTTFLCAPLTTKKKLSRFQALCTTHRIGYALMDQIRTCDTRRLMRKIGTSSEEEFSQMLSVFRKIYMM